MSEDYKDHMLDDDEGVFDSDGAVDIGPKDLDFFTGTQDRTYRIGFVYFDEPLSNIPKDKREALKEKINAGQIKVVQTKNGDYIRRPRFLYSKTHWSKETGTFRCFKGLCCKELDMAKTKAATLIVEYSTDKDGNVKKPFNYEVKILALNETLYKDIKRVNDNFALLGTDVLLTCTNEQYKTFKAQPSKGSLWQDNDEIVADVLSTCNDNWDMLKVRALGKKMSEEQFKAARGIADRLMAVDLSTDVSAELADILAG